MKHPTTATQEADPHERIPSKSVEVDELQLMEMYRQIAQNPAYDALARGAASTRYQMIKRLYARQPKPF